MKFKVPFILIDDIMEKHEDFSIDALRQLVEAEEVTLLARITRSYQSFGIDADDDCFYEEEIAEPELKEHEWLTNEKTYLYDNNSDFFTVRKLLELEQSNEIAESMGFNGYFEMTADCLDDGLYVFGVGYGDESRKLWAIRKPDNFTDNLYILKSDYEKLYLAQGEKADEKLNSGDWVRVKALLDELIALKKSVGNPKYNQAALVADLAKYGFGFGKESLDDFFAEANKRGAELAKRKAEHDVKNGKS